MPTHYDDERDRIIPRRPADSIPGIFTPPPFVQGVVDDAKRRATQLATAVRPAVEVAQNVVPNLQETRAAGQQALENFESGVANTAKRAGKMATDIATGVPKGVAKVATGFGGAVAGGARATGKAAGKYVTDPRRGPPTDPNTATGRAVRRASSQLDHVGADFREGTAQSIGRGIRNTLAAPFLAAGDIAQGSVRDGVSAIGDALAPAGRFAAGFFGLDGPPQDDEPTGTTAVPTVGDRTEQQPTAVAQAAQEPANEVGQAQPGDEPGRASVRHAGIETSVPPSRNTAHGSYDDSSRVASSSRTPAAAVAGPPNNQGVEIIRGTVRSRVDTNTGIETPVGMSAGQGARFSGYSNAGLDSDAAVKAMLEEDQIATQRMNAEANMISSRAQAQNARTAAQAKFIPQQFVGPNGQPMIGGIRQNPDGSLDMIDFKLEAFTPIDGRRGINVIQNKTKNALGEEVLTERAVVIDLATGQEVTPEGADAIRDPQSLRDAFQAFQMKNPNGNPDELLARAIEYVRKKEATR